MRQNERQTATILTQAQLMQELRYEPDTGKFFRLVDKRSGKPSGKETGTLRKDGYVRLWLDGRMHNAHRLAFLYMAGEFPAAEIDHINGVKSDNRWCNLRAATASENSQNLRAAMSTSRSGLLGVSRHKKSQKWMAQITVAGMRHHLGLFTCPHEAHAAYLKAKDELHPFSTLSGPEIVGY